MAGLCLLLINQSFNSDVCIDLLSWRGFSATAGSRNGVWVLGMQGLLAHVGGDEAMYMMIEPATFDRPEAVQEFIEEILPTPRGEQLLLF